MAVEDYLTASTRLSRQLAELRRTDAPAEWLAATLMRLVDLHLKHQNPAAARATLEVLGGLRLPGRPMVEATYYLGSAQVADRAGEGARALWLVEAAVALGRKHRLEEFLPHALLSYSDLLLSLDREEESRWAATEAIVRFEQTGQSSHAAAALLAHRDSSETDAEPAVVRQALSLAEQGDAPAVTAWALKSLGRWHMERGEYLPARLALDRAVKVARDQADEADVSGCLADLSWLEGLSSNHDEAVHLASEAVRTAPSPFWKGYALEAREAALNRLQQYGAAREDLLEAARCFEADGHPDMALDVRQRARGQRVAIFLHRLPRWVFRPEDVSGRAPPPPNHFQPLVAWAAGLGLLFLTLWTRAWLSAAGVEEDRVIRAVDVVAGLEPWVVLLAAALLSLRDRLLRPRV